MDELNKRVMQEQQEYDEGSCTENCAFLQNRYSHVFQCPNTLYAEKFYEDKIAESVSQAAVLDYGCYNGWLCPALVRHGAKKIIGIDISKKGIQEATEKFGKFAEYRVMDAHKLDFPDKSFDVVAGRAILHHLNFEIAMKEITRVLKPGGTALFIEPLRDNPAAKLFRKLTPKAHTKDEMPLSREQLDFANGLFSENSHCYFGLFSTAFGLLTSRLSQNPQNWLLKISHRIDLEIARTPLKYWMRAVVLCWKK